MRNPFGVVKDFEDAVCEYTNAPLCVAVSSCTAAIFLCLYWAALNKPRTGSIIIPKKTYVGVAQSAKHVANLFDMEIIFKDENWSGCYQIEPYSIYDSARRFTHNMWGLYHGPDHVACTSHHWSKPLGISHGGCILHDDAEADAWLRRARFDGRTEGVPAKNDRFQVGWHMYMLPEIAAAGLVRLSHLPKNNPDLPNDDYPDLSETEIFK